MSKPWECCACGIFFTSLEAFDRHRTGVHEFTFQEGLRMDPPREDGRRCFDFEELSEKGWTQDARGAWHDPSRSGRARAAFAG